MKFIQIPLQKSEIIRMYIVYNIFVCKFGTQYKSTKNFLLLFVEI